MMLHRCAAAADEEPELIKTKTTSQEQATGGVNAEMAAFRWQQHA
jgi:hypothetical protein